MDYPLIKGEPNRWILFTQKVDSALDAAGISRGVRTVSKQFASWLKDIKPYSEWTDDDIVEAWSTWEKPEQSKSGKAKAEAEVEYERLREAFAAARRARLVAEREEEEAEREEEEAEREAEVAAKKARHLLATARSARAQLLSSVAAERSLPVHWAPPASAMVLERKPRAKLTEQQKADKKAKRNATRGVLPSKFGEFNPLSALYARESRHAQNAAEQKAVHSLNARESERAANLIFPSQNHTRREQTWGIPYVGPGFGGSRKRKPLRKRRRSRKN